MKYGKMKQLMNDNSPMLLKKQQGINSIEIGMQILKTLARQGAPMTLGEISSATQMQPAKAHRYLVSLIRTGMVQQYAHNGSYELGAYALEFSLGCLAKLESLRIDSSVLKTLAMDIEESVFSAVWSANGPMVVDWYPANRSITASTRIGTVFSLLMSSTGRVCGAYLSESITKSLIDRELADLAQSDNPQAPRSRAQVDEIFAEVRERGLARGIGIRWPSISSFSVPIFDYRGRLISVLTAFGYNETFDTAWDGRIAGRLKSTAETLSRQRGHGV